MLTTKEAASILEVTTCRVRQLIYARALTARKRGRDWSISPADVARYKETRKIGRPVRKGYK